MTTRNDFRVQQTYDEIRQYVYRAALIELMKVAFGSSEAADARERARRIADQAVSRLDAAEDQ